MLLENGLPPAGDEAPFSGGRRLQSQGDSGPRRRDPAIDFLDAHAGGVVGLPDIEVLSIAAESGRILVSHDRRTMPAQFARFLPTRPSPGLIIVDQDLDISRSIEELLLIWAVTDADEGQGKIGYLPI